MLYSLLTNISTEVKVIKTTKIILGIDLGTTGLRACVVRKEQTAELLWKEKILAETEVYIEAAQKSNTTNQIMQSPDLWIEGFKKLITQLSALIDLQSLTHLIFDATSSTVLILDPSNQTYTDALMYNDNHAQKQAKRIDLIIAMEKEKQSIHLKYNQNGAQGASSTLAKALSLLEKAKQDQPNNLHTLTICHQIDFLNFYLTGIPNMTDENNALKLGYDLIHQTWPNWVDYLVKDICPSVDLPKVIKPGEYMGKIRPKIAKNFGFNPNLNVMAGTTDSIAGFLASGAEKPGDAVTSLGSTIAIKALTHSPIFNPTYGIYSHKLGDHWLVGGASNSGGQVLKHFYSIKQLKHLNQFITQTDIDNFSQTNTKSFYPLITPGERFPISDALMKPCLPEKPDCDQSEMTYSKSCLNAHKLFLLQLLHGLTAIEKLSYERLENLTSEKPIQVKRIYSVGGGTLSNVWMQMRKETLKPMLCQPKQKQAAYGVTRLV